MSGETVREEHESHIVVGNNHSRKDDVLAKYMHGKEKEWAAVADKKEPLQLLDLPTAVLHNIVKEVTHTNDLTSLALTHSALHAIVIPLIYSRFDIVWPDTLTTTESRVGVDALTYGLATLVMAKDVFGETPVYPRPKFEIQKCDHCGKLNQCSHYRQSSPLGARRPIRRGNNFAEHTQKFSLSNGPSEWVSEYQINKESGKMLGTLVALAVGRMRNLETFVWDMPTGILRDIFIALASLGKRDDEQECKLDRVWVRWHDNSDGTPHSHALPAAQSNPTLNFHGQTSTITNLLQSHQSLFQIPPYPRVEFPTFSILPPLGSLTVLDVDELPYAEEMCVLIEKSASRLRELRLGLAKHAQYDMWVRPSESTAIPSPPASSSERPTQPGGFLELLFSGICDTSPANLSDETNSGILKAMHSSVAVHELGVVEDESTSAAQEQDVENLTSMMSTQTLQPTDTETDTVEGTDDIAHTLKPSTELESPTPLTCTTPQTSSSRVTTTSNVAMQSSTSLPETYFEAGQGRSSSTKLKLEVLELERVPLSIPVMSKAIDWTRLHTLTILGCRNHDQLWKALRKRFTPESRSRTSSVSTRSSFKVSLPLSRSSILDEQYALNIRHLHTDMVSPSLIAFLKDTLAADSLESLFLQECPAYKSPVSIDMIYKAAVKRHRASLKKLSIDSKLRVNNDGTDTSWRRWVYSRELLSFITSGKMSALRELGLAVDYKDWHMFLQRLPNVTQLRSLYICRIAGHVHGRYDSREAALQVLDVVSLRPELELCYLGIESKCFEVLEYPAGRKPSLSDFSNINSANATGHSDGESDDDATSDGQVGATADQSEEQEESDFELTSSRGGDTEDDMSDIASKSAKQFKLREILFYDDKVSVFKARHGKL